MTKFNISATDKPLITVQGTINGEGPYNFVFDTGASTTVIEKETAKKLGLMENAALAQARGASGENLETYISKVDSIRVDDYEVKDIQVAIIDLSGLSRLCFNNELAGIIGYNFVKDTSVIIDYPEQEISFIPQE